MVFGSGFSQRGGDTPRSPRDSFCANPLDHVDRRQQDQLVAQTLDQGRGQDDAFIGLPCEIIKTMSRWPVVPHGEWLETEDRLQFDQMFSSCLVPLAIFSPTLRRRVELRGHQAQQGRERRFLGAEYHAWIAHVAKLHRVAQAVCWSAMLAKDGQVGLAERVMPDQAVLVVG